MLIKFNDLPNKEEFKCNTCHKWLSVSPVLHDPFHGYVCGRCEHSVVESEQVQRQVAYEALAQHILFPCANSDKGCTAELKWNAAEVMQHEKHCKFTTICCPLPIVNNLHECKWNGSYAELYQHVQQLHPDHVLNPPHFKLDFENEKAQIYFANACAKDFLIYTKFDKSCDKFYGLVLYIGLDAENEFYRYQFELWDSDNINSVILRRNKMEEACDLRRKFVDSSMLLQIDIPTVKTLLNNSNSILCKVGIAKKSNKELAGVKLPKPVNNPIKTQEVPQNKQPRVSHDILEDLECPVCKEYLAPPIYICATGHSICSTCSLNIDTCPSCNQSLKNTRNYTLEKMTERVQYPCRNNTKNCTFVGNIDTIFQHESQCNSTEKQCVAKCKWFGSTPAMVDHLKSKHADYVLDTTDVLKRNIKDPVTVTYHIICFDREVFRFSCKHSTANGPIRFNVQHFGMTKPTYKYVLEFFDYTGRGLEFVVGQLCQKHTELPSESLKNCLFIPLEMLESFLFEKSILLFQLKLVKLKD